MTCRSSSDQLSSLLQVSVMQAVTAVAGAGVGIVLAPVLAPAAVGVLGFSASGVVGGMLRI